VSIVFYDLAEFLVGFGDSFRPIQWETPGAEQPNDGGGFGSKVRALERIGRSSMPSVLEEPQERFLFEEKLSLAQRGGAVLSD